MSVAPTDALSPLLDEQVQRNRRRARMLLADLVLNVVVVVALIGLLLGAFVPGLLAGLILGAALAVSAFRRSTSVIVSKSGAHPAGATECARLHNLVEGLCAGAGLPKPEVYLVDDDALNAFVAGRTPRDAVLAVTTGLATSLSRIELEGVLAQLLSRVKNLDILPSTLAVTVLGPLLRVLPPAPALRLVEAAIGTGREALADLTAVSLTRYPPGLLSALEKLRDRGTAVTCATRATAHLWLAAPLAGGAGPAFDVHPSLDSRIAALREL